MCVANDERIMQLLVRMNKLLAVNLVKGLQLRDQVLILDFGGFTPKEIADVVHKTPRRSRSSSVDCHQSMCRSLPPPPRRMRRRCRNCIRNSTSLKTPLDY